MTEAAEEPQKAEAAQLALVVPASEEAEAVVVARALTLHEQIVALVIESDADLEKAADLLAANKTLQGVVGHDLGEPAAEAYKLWKMIRARFTKYDDPLKADETVLKTKVGDYHRRAARLREQEIEAAQAQAKAHDEDQTARAAEAEALLDAGDDEGAQAVLDEAPTPAPARPTSAPKTKGLSVREIWRAEITSMQDLILAAAEGDTVAFSILSDAKVRQAAATAASAIAKGMKANMKVPGVRAYPDTGVAAGKR